MHKKHKTLFISPRSVILGFWFCIILCLFVYYCANARNIVFCVLRRETHRVVDCIAYTYVFETLQRKTRIMWVLDYGIDGGIRINRIKLIWNQRLNSAGRMQWTECLKSIFAGYNCRHIVSHLLFGLFFSIHFNSSNRFIDSLDLLLIFVIRLSHPTW